MRRSLALVPLLSLLGCEGTMVGLDGASAASVDDPGPAEACQESRRYIGLGGADLAHDREAGAAGDETRRPIPFSAMSGEYTRMLGRAPTLLKSSESTFGTSPARWFVETNMGAVSVYTAFRIAFQGCLGTTAKPARYQTVPTDAAARLECAAWAERAWNRAPDAPELASCVEATVRGTTSETDPRRRWAYGCAVVLTTADFLTF